VSTTDERQFGDIASKLLFENERTRVWELRLEPGASTDVHHHDNDYVMIQIEGDKIAADFEPDSEDEWNGAEVGRVEADVANGTVVFAKRGGKERAVNSGTEPFYEIVVEFLD
jgi:hypothetical protein